MKFLLLYCRAVELTRLFNPRQSLWQQDLHINGRRRRDLFFTRPTQKMAHLAKSPGKCAKIHQDPKKLCNNAHLANRDEQMSMPFSLLNDEQMSNWLGVEHLPDMVYRMGFWGAKSVDLDVIISRFDVNNSRSSCHFPVTFEFSRLDCWNSCLVLGAADPPFFAH